MKPSDLKLIVQEKYGKIASSAETDSGSCCCTPGCCSSEGLQAFNESYNHLDEYLGFIKQNGFAGMKIHKEKRIEMPDGVISHHDGIEESGVFSITISASKPHLVG
jgi:hypothetical protein